MERPNCKFYRENGIAAKKPLQWNIKANRETRAQETKFPAQIKKHKAKAQKSMMITYTIIISVIYLINVE